MRVAGTLRVNVYPVVGTASPWSSLEPGSVDARTGRVVEREYANRTTLPNNPLAQAAEET
jgi:dihydropyrimidine dehydrogenase (NAD+) subunit PreA